MPDDEHNELPSSRRVEDVFAFFDRFFNVLGDFFRCRGKEPFLQVCGHWGVNDSRLNVENLDVVGKKTASNTVG